jgi:hypothetical protein
LNNRLQQQVIKQTPIIPKEEEIKETEVLPVKPKRIFPEI